ncbi:MAG: CDP-diacylglycerol--glycerol-3-phosphate 3-phosphatidyltransferase [Thermodesulfobacteriota bacterium]
MLHWERIKKIIQNPNFLTLFRMASSLFILLLLLRPNRLTAFLAALLFSLAAITDFFDGFFARRYGTVSNFGKAMDPLADKLLVSTSLIMMSSHGWIPAWIACIIIGREIAVTGLRNVIAGRGEDIAASLLGKYKTGFQIAAIIPLLLHYPYFGLRFHLIGIWLLWGALIFTLWSGADYFYRFRRLLEK